MGKRQLSISPAGYAIIKFIFFGNYFYGLCAAALSIEATLQQNYPLNNLCYYLAVTVATAFYYTIAYIGEHEVAHNNKRTQWYSAHNNIIQLTQILFACSLAIYGIYTFGTKNFTAHLNYFSIILIIIFPIVAGLYYGFNSRLLGSYNLRNVGWLKPFVIGFSWAGAVTIYPVLFYCMNNDMVYQPTLFTSVLFIKNFMFISVLCILFDIKDYATDHNHQLKTFVLNAGLRKTIFYIVIPLSVIGLGSFLSFATIIHLSFMKVILNTIPFILLIAVAYSLHRRRSILYYLIIIDGLMLAKAICGSTAMLFF